MAASSEDENSNWEDDSSSSSSSEEEEEQKQPPPKIPAAALKPRSPKQKSGEFKIPARLRQTLDDPDAERARIEEINLLRDRHLSGNMFGDSSGEDEEDEGDVASPKAEVEGRAQKLLKVAQISGAEGGSRLKSTGGDASASLRAMPLARLQDVEALCGILCPKITSSIGKSQVWLRMLDLLLQSCAEKMDPQDLFTLQRKVQTAANERKRAVNFQLTSSKKGTDLKVDIRNPRAELEIAAGLGASDYSESEEAGCVDDDGFGL